MAAASYGGPEPTVTETNFNNNASLTNSLQQFAQNTLVYLFIRKMLHIHAK